MAESGKTILEREFATFIRDRLVVGGALLDPDLTPRQQLKATTGGYLLQPEDKKKGPLVRLKIMNYVKKTEESGNGEEGRSALYNVLLRIDGISLYGPNLAQVVADRNDIEAILRLNVLRFNMPQLQSTLTGGKGEFAAQLEHMKAEFFEEVVPGERSAPVIGPALPADTNTGHALVVTDPKRIYSGDDLVVFTIEIVTPNTTPGSLAGLTYRYKLDEEPFSGALAATADYALMADGVAIKITLGPGLSAAAGDAWTITASANAVEYLASFRGEWNIAMQMDAGPG
jgi:hypothetical protein